ncbi:YggT family protein [Thermocrinis jamiesonii]|uniref:YggT family protein n=1 Tax=Thermocrinis jamiesonii TaxID=1302351 RepID=UPI000497C1F5
MTLEQFLNYTLAFFMWLVLGRATLEFFTQDLNNFFYRFFYKFTEPLYKPYRVVFPCCHTILLLTTLLLLRFLVIKLL